MRKNWSRKEDVQERRILENSILWADVSDLCFWWVLKMESISCLMLFKWIWISAGLMYAWLTACLFQHCMNEVCSASTESHWFASKRVNKLFKGNRKNPCCCLQGSCKSEGDQCAYWLIDRQGVGVYSVCVYMILCYTVLRELCMTFYAFCHFLLLE